MSKVVQLDKGYFVAPQLMESDFELLKSQGFERIINNRPDGESEDQPLGESLRHVVESLGMEYIHNPIDLSRLSAEHVDIQSQALTGSKKTLAFCRTGTRSSVLWVLMENAKGVSVDDLVAYVSGKGFDLSRCTAAMAPLLSDNK